MKRILIAHNIFKPDELKAYENRILDNKNLTEQQASRFFVEFPKFLSIGDYRELAREVTLYRGDGEPIHRVDFIRRQYGQQFWDIVELKTPKVPLLVRSGKHWKLSSKIEDAAHQALGYRELLNEYYNRIETEKKTGIKLFNPKILLIGGRDGEEIDIEEVRRIAFRYNNIDIYSYNDLYKFAQDNYKSNIVAIPVIQASPIDIPIFGNIDLNFKFFKTTADSPARPTLPLTLTNPINGRSFKTWGLVDTGADCCAMPASLASMIGCDAKKGWVKQIATSNGVLNAFSHQVEIGLHSVAGDNFSDHVVLREILEVDFLPNLDTTLIGTNFLSGFQLTIDYSIHQFTLTRK